MKTKGQIHVRDASEKPSQGISARVKKTDLQSGAFLSHATKNPLLIFPGRYKSK